MSRIATWKSGTTSFVVGRTGYWRSQLGSRYALDVWERVAVATKRGDLGVAAELRQLQGHGAAWYELRVYLDDIGDKAEVARVRSVMRDELGFVHPIGCYRMNGTLRYRDQGAKKLPLRMPWSAKRKPERSTA
jgi:hypothetical protein